jgi:hypothetical protein
MKLQPIRKESLPGRNVKCPCGSGKKAKKCCLPRIKQLASLPPEVRTQAIIAGILGHWPTTEPTPERTTSPCVTPPCS